MDHDDKEFATALVSMAVKGFLRIEERGGRFPLEKLGDDTSMLSKGERTIAAHLFGTNVTLQLERMNHESIRPALLAFQDNLESEYEGAYFNRNSGFFVGGACLSMLVLLVLVGPALASPSAETVLSGIITTGSWSRSHSQLTSFTSQSRVPCRCELDCEQRRSSVGSERCRST